MSNHPWNLHKSLNATGLPLLRPFTVPRIKPQIAAFVNVKTVSVLDPWRGALFSPMFARDFARRQRHCQQIVTYP
jgi:hypothetical protein